MKLKNAPKCLKLRYPMWLPPPGWSLLFSVSFWLDKVKTWIKCAFVGFPTWAIWWHIQIWDTMWRNRLDIGNQYLEPSSPDHPDLSPVDEIGWMHKEGQLVPLLLSLPPMPKACREFTSCGCTKGCLSQCCSCRYVYRRLSDVEQCVQVVQIW